MPERAAEKFCQVFEFGVDHLVKQSFAIREVVIDRHGRDADLIGDPPHAYSLWAFGLEKAESALVDLL